jgi:hypothetical protein
MFSISVIILHLLFFLVLTVRAYDEVSNFCSRWDHQSAVKNNRLYIDGITKNILFESVTNVNRR